MKSERSKACDISPQVKQAVWERDNGACVVCGNRQNVMPNAHFIRRSRGGLGIEQNIVTLCTDLTPNQCHTRLDRYEPEIEQAVREYLRSRYDGWNEQYLYYKNPFRRQP